MMQDPDFTDLLRRVSAGDPSAAVTIVQRYESAIRLEARVRLRMQDARVRQQFDSGDICQSVLADFFVRMAAGEYHLERPQQLHGLLVRMAQNKLLERVRYLHRQQRDIRRTSAVDNEPVAYSESTPSQVVANRELLAAVMGRLSTEERYISERRSQGYEWSDIARELGGTPEGRRKQFSRAIGRAMSALGMEKE